MARVAEGSRGFSGTLRADARTHAPSQGIYVLYTYAARRATARAVQTLLSNPEAGSEDVLLRFTTFCKF